MRPLVLAAAGLLLAAPVARAQEAGLTVTATSGKGDRGKVVAALFDAEAAYRATKDPVRTAEVALTGGAARIAWSDLPPGRYAAVLYHDVNADGRLNTLPVGLPTEPYGFSNNVRGRFGPASWTAASFEVKPGANAQAVSLK